MEVASMRCHWRMLMVLMCCGFALAGWTRDKIETAQQAIARAATFIKAVGWITTATPTATFSDSASFTKMWDVQYRQPGKSDAVIELRVDRTTGQVHGAIDMFPINDQPVESSKTITPEQAKATAENVLHAAGISVRSFKLETSLSDSIASSPNAKQWGMFYRRIYAGYTFNNDTIQIILNPRNASLIRLLSFAQSPEPKSAKLVKTEADARTIAQIFLPEHKWAIARIETAKLFIVQANNFFDRTTPTPTVPVSRLAWVVHCIRAGDGHYVEAWIDAENGEVIGGAACR